MVSYICQSHLDDFPAWNGGKGTIDTIKKYDSEHGTDFFKKLSDMAEEFFGFDDHYTLEQVNSWLWFEGRDYEEFEQIFR